MVGGGREVRGQRGGGLLGILARRRIDDRRTALRIAQQIERALGPHGLRHFDHFDGEVVAAEAVDEARGVVQRKLREDVVLNDGCCGRGQRQDRRGAQQVQMLAEHAVVGAEIVAPLRDAVRLVDGDERRLALAQHLGKAGDAQPLRRDEEKLQAAVQVVDAGLARALAIQSGVNARDLQTACRELGGLIFHERDERADDQRGAAARDGRQLVAERFARAGRHHQQDIAAGDRRAADLFLVGAEGREAEGAGEQAGEGVRAACQAHGCIVGDIARSGREGGDDWGMRLTHRRTVRGGEAARRLRAWTRWARRFACLRLRDVFRRTAAACGVRRNAATGSRKAPQRKKTNDQREGEPEGSGEEARSCARLAGQNNTFYPQLLPKKRSKYTNPGPEKFCESMWLYSQRIRRRWLAQQDGCHERLRIRLLAAKPTGGNRERPYTKRAAIPPEETLRK